MVLVFFFQIRAAATLLQPCFFACDTMELHIAIGIIQFFQSSRLWSYQI